MQRLFLRQDTPGRPNRGEERNNSMKRAFVSFDYDHDKGVKEMLAGQEKNPDTPFSIADFSIKEVISSDWKAKLAVAK